MIIRHDRRDRESMVDPYKWPAITNFFKGHGAASLIAPTWLLTAAHVARTLSGYPSLAIEIGGKRYRIARSILYPGYDPTWEGSDESDTREMVDLALVELETPVTDVPPYQLYTGSDEVGQEMLLLGSGQHGDGIRGGRGNDGQLRRVTNIVEEADDYWLTFCFDEPPDGTPLEGVCGNGDSGGPSLIQQNGSLLLAGISSWQDHRGRSFGCYGCIEHFTRVSRYIDWIQASIS